MNRRRGRKKKGSQPASPAQWTASGRDALRAPRRPLLWGAGEPPRRAAQCFLPGNQQLARSRDGVAGSGTGEEVKIQPPKRNAERGESEEKKLQCRKSPCARRQGDCAGWSLESSPRRSGKCPHVQSSPAGGCSAAVRGHFQKKWGSMKRQERKKRCARVCVRVCVCVCVCVCACERACAGRRG